MEKVFIVSTEYSLIGVFSTNEKANEVKKLVEQQQEFRAVFVKECKVDPEVKELRHFQ